jgi:hypothetical protein
MNKISIALFALLLSAGTSSYAASYSVKQVSNQPISNESPLINDEGDVVWVGTDATFASRLYLYNAATATTTQLNNENVLIYSYHINKQGDVVWVGYASTGQEAFLYQAKTKQVIQLTSGNFNPFDDGPQLSDNGDVVWTGPQGTSANVMRYEAATGITSALIFPGATGQGYPRINGRGDVAWGATVGAHTQILLFKAADRSIVDISRRNRDDYFNVQINDRGDVLWNGSDGHDTEMYLYRGATKESVQLTRNDFDDDSFQLGSNGDAVWVGNATTSTRVITLYRARTGGISSIATLPTFPSVFPQIDGNADVVWKSYVGTDIISNLYDAASKKTIQLTNTPASQGFGAYDLVLADNGDVVWSLWDGTDYEVYTYQASTKATTQLTKNSGDDGIVSVNAGGDLAFMHFNAADSQIMVARKRR